MKTRFTLFAVPALALLAAGCSDAPAPAPAPDPAELDRLLASLQPQDDAAGDARLPDQVAQVDRVSGTVARLSPEKLDPNLVATFIAR